MLERRRFRFWSAAVATFVAAVPALAAEPADLVNAIRTLDAGNAAASLPVVQGYALAGNITAQNELGWLYETGHGVPRDYGEAVKWYRLAALAGSASDQNNLGRMYESGLGVPRNYTEAEKWFRLSALQGFAMGQYDLAYLHDRGLGTVPPFAETLALYKQAADQGLATAQYQYGLSAANGHVAGANADAVALDYLTRAADQGYAPALVTLGQFRETGRAGPRNYLLAFELYRRAADGGDGAAMVHLAALYELGQGVARNEQEAARWYRLAVERNVPRAAYRLGLIADQGLVDGVRNPGEAVKWMRMAADAGNLADAQNQLGLYYDQGRGVEADPTEAARWFRRAAAQNSAPAMANLAHAYQTGRGVPADPAEAKRWQNLAVAHGFKPTAATAPKAEAPTPPSDDFLAVTGIASAPPSTPACPRPTALHVAGCP
jgi:TPR repeat protein